jgi:hypothetical protein
VHEPMTDRPEVADARRSRLRRRDETRLAPFTRALGNAFAAPNLKGSDVAGVGDRVITYGIALSVGGLIVQTLLHLGDVVVFDSGVNSFDADEDYGAGAWASVVATFAAAVGALLISIITRHRVFVALAALFTLLSFDDFMGLHERAGEAGTLVGIDQELELGRVIWPLLLLPLLITGAALLWYVSKGFDGRPSLLLRAGLVLLGAAVALEAASAALFQVDYGHRSWPYELEVILEEGAELVGSVWIATALLAAACSMLVEAGRRR